MGAYYTEFDAENLRVGFSISINSSSNITDAIVTTTMPMTTTTSRPVNIVVKFFENIVAMLKKWIGAFLSFLKLCWTAKKSHFSTKNIAILCFYYNALIWWFFFITTAEQALSPLYFDLLSLFLHTIVIIIFFVASPPIWSSNIF